jgi:hypothetical protein
VVSRNNVIKQAEHLGHITGLPPAHRMSQIFFVKVHQGIPRATLNTRVPPAGSCCGACYWQHFLNHQQTSQFRLGRVDKLNPDSDAGKQHEGGEALDQLVVAGGDTA